MTNKLFRTAAQLAAVFIMLATAVVAGCSDNRDEIKSAALQAVAKQADVANYSFEGTAELDLAMPAAGDGFNPVASGLLSLLKESTLAWRGTAASDPLRLELDLQVTPKGADKPFEIPVLIQDNKIYFNIPLLSKPDEFFVYDLQPPAGQESKVPPFTADAVGNVSLAKLTGALLDSMAIKWFAENKEDVVLPDGQKATTITATVKPGQFKTWSPQLADKLPDLLKAFSFGAGAGGAGADGRTAADVQSYLKGIVLNEPAVVAVTVDDKGFVRKQEVRLDYTRTAADGHTSQTAVHMTNEIRDINANPAFKRGIPANPIPFENVLKLLKSGS